MRNKKAAWIDVRCWNISIYNLIGQSVTYLCLIIKDCVHFWIQTALKDWEQEALFISQPHCVIKYNKFMDLDQFQHIVCFFRTVFLHALILISVLCLVVFTHVEAAFRPNKDGSSLGCFWFTVSPICSLAPCPTLFNTSTITHVTTISCSWTYFYDYIKKHTLPWCYMRVIYECSAHISLAGDLKKKLTVLNVQGHRREKIAFEHGKGKNFTLQWQRGRWKERSTSI